MDKTSTKCFVISLFYDKSEWRLFCSRPGTLPEDGVINPTKTSGVTTSFQNFGRGKVPTLFLTTVPGL